MNYLCPVFAEKGNSEYKSLTKKNVYEENDYMGLPVNAAHDLCSR